MNGLRVFLARLWVYFWEWSRGFSAWSKIHRLIFDRAARGLKLPICKDPGEIAAYLRGMGWRQDSWIDLGDAICSPEMVWLRFLTDVENHKKKVGDCDEFACFSANVIQESIKEGKWDSVCAEPKILCTTWFDSIGRPGGHAVCLVKWQSKDHPITTLSGDEMPLFGYMDYDLPRFHGSVPDVVAAIRKRYAGAGYTGICWSIYTPGLGLQEIHWG